MDFATRNFLERGAVAGGHVGLIVRENDFLASAVSEWAGQSLRAGGGAILVGSAVHLEQIRDAMRRAAIDVGGAEREGRAVLIEADWLLGKFMIDGSPQATLFRALLDEILTRMVAIVGSPERVRAWGEMVSLLRLRQNNDAAMKLESLWESALHEKGFSLLCSYHTGDRLLSPPEDLIRDVANTHASWLVEPAPPMRSL